MQSRLAGPLTYANIGFGLGVQGAMAVMPAHEDGLHLAWAGGVLNVHSHGLSSKELESHYIVEPA